MKVILISGKAEAGKDSTFLLLQHHIKEYARMHHSQLKMIRMAYGDYVKETAKQIFGWDGKKDEAGRALLQYWGTEHVRAISPDFWVDTIIRLAPLIQDQIDYLVITDVRFPNEILAWKHTDFEVLTVRVERPGHINALIEIQRNHLSETALDNWNFDITLSASNWDDLEKQVILKLLPKVHD